MKNKQAKDIMHSPVIKAKENSSIKECIEIMKNQNIGFLPITKNNILVGVVTDRDILTRSLGKYKLNSNIAKIMTSTNLIFVNEDSELKECESLMIANNIHRLIVLKDGSITGIITSKDLLKENHNITILKDDVLPFYKPYDSSNNSDSIKIDDYRL